MYTVPSLMVPQKHESNSYNISTEDLLLTLACPVIVAAVYMIPYEPCLVDTVSHALLVNPL